MATYIFKDGYVSMAGQDLSDHVKSITLDDGIETQDKTAMGMDSRQMKGGLKTWSITVELHQDFASNEVDDVVDGLTDREAALIVKPNGDTTSSTNPKWTGTGLLTSYNPIGGSVGDLAGASLTFEAASDLTRATSD